MPAVKAHIGNSTEPLKEHRDIKAVCGVLVLNVEFLGIWDAKKVPPAESQEWRGVCRKCREKELPENMVYIIMNADDLRTKLFKNLEKWAETDG